MFFIDRRILTHFDFILILLVLPLLILSNSLIGEVHPILAHKQLIYYGVGFLIAILVFMTPIRKYQWLIPPLYWLNILLLLSVEFFGVTKLGATRWLELPFVHISVQPSEFFKITFVLMLAYLISKNPPPKRGYGLIEFLKLAFYIVLPFLIIVKEPDLGTATIILILGFGVLFIVGVRWQIWAIIFAFLIGFIPFAYYNLFHDYQKKRVNDFLSKDKPSYHVQQSIIAIGSGGLYGKAKDDATQTQLKFLPISTSDFIFAYLNERYGFLGSLFVISIYAMLILYLLALSKSLANDYFTQVIAISIAFLLFVYSGVNIAMTIGFAPVVGVPLPIFSYGGSSFINFIVLFAILEKLLAFRYNFLYNSTPTGKKGL